MALELRLLIFSSEFPPGPGGIGTHAYQLANQLARLGTELLVLSPQDYSNEAEINGFNHTQAFQVRRLRPLPFPPMEAIYRWHSLHRATRSFRPDLVLATGSRSAWLATYYCQNNRIPWLAIGHGTEFGARRGFGPRLTRWAFNRADTVICVSEYTRSVMQLMGIRPRACFVVHNGADTKRFQPSSEARVRQLREKWGLVNHFVLLTVGNVTPRKGQEVVIRALPEIVKHIPNVVYLMAGLPTIQDQLTELADGLGVQEHVRFLGRVDSDQLVELYQSCDLFLMTSRRLDNGDFEGFGIAAIEAALCGKPAIVSSGSGLEEAVVDGCTGLVVSEGDSQAVARAVVRLFQDDGLRCALAEAAYRRARQEYGWDQIAGRYLQIMRGLLS